MTLHEFCSRALFATYATVLTGGTCAVFWMLVREVRANLEWEKDLKRRRAEFEERKRVRRTSP